MTTNIQNPIASASPDMVDKKKGPAKDKAKDIIQAEQTSSPKIYGKTSAMDAKR